MMQHMREQLKEQMNDNIVHNCTFIQDQKNVAMIDHQIYVIDLMPFLEQSSDQLQQTVQGLFSDILDKLPKDRREKVLQFKQPKDQLRSLAAGVLLNYAVQSYQDINHVGIYEKSKASGEESALIDMLYIDLTKCIAAYRVDFNYKIVKGKDQKPTFKDHADIWFNLTHSGRYVCCIIGQTPCGIDVEGHRKVRIETAKRIFTDSEYEWMTHVDEFSNDGSLNEAKETDKMKDDSKKEMDRRFFQLWTLKEAYSKADGSGIYKNIRKVSFHPLLQSFLEFDDSELNQNFLIRSYQLSDDYYLSAVIQK